VVGVGAKWCSQAILLLEFYGRCFLYFCGISDFVWIVSIDVTCNLCPFKISHIFTSPTPQIFLSHPCDSPNFQQNYLHYLVSTAVNSHVGWHLGLPTDKSECNFGQFTDF